MKNLNFGACKAAVIIMAVVTICLVFFLPFFSISYADVAEVLPEYRGETLSLSYYDLLSTSKEVGGFGFLEIIAIFSTVGVAIFAIKNSFVSARNFSIVGIIGIILVVVSLTTMSKAEDIVTNVKGGLGAWLGIAGYVVTMVLSIIANKKYNEQQSNMFTGNDRANFTVNPNSPNM